MPAPREAVLAEDGIHLEFAQGGVALFKAGAGAGDAIAPEAHRKAAALLTALHNCFTLAGITQINAHSNRLADGVGPLGLRRCRTTHQADRQRDHSER